MRGETLPASEARLKAMHRQLTQGDLGSGDDESRERIMDSMVMGVYLLCAADRERLAAIQATQNRKDRDA